MNQTFICDISFFVFLPPDTTFTFDWMLSTSDLYLPCLLLLQCLAMYLWYKATRMVPRWKYHTPAGPYNWSAKLATEDPLQSWSGSGMSRKWCRMWSTKLSPLPVMIRERTLKAPCRCPYKGTVKMTLCIAVRRRTALWLVSHCPLSSPSVFYVSEEVLYVTLHCHRLY